MLNDLGITIVLKELPSYHRMQNAKWNYDRWRPTTLWRRIKILFNRRMWKLIKAEYEAQQKITQQELLNAVLEQGTK